MFLFLIGWKTFTLESAAAQKIAKIITLPITFFWPTSRKLLILRSFFMTLLFLFALWMNCIFCLYVAFISKQLTFFVVCNVYEYLLCIRQLFAWIKIYKIMIWHATKFMQYFCLFVCLFMQMLALTQESSHLWILIMMIINGSFVRVCEKEAIYGADDCFLWKVLCRLLLILFFSFLSHYRTT